MSADMFVYLDTVQFSKNGVQNRNQIKTPQGARWLTVPVKHELGSSIRETEIAEPRALEKHWKTLQINYSRTAGFERWGTELGELLRGKFHTIDDIAIASTEWLLQKLEVHNKRVRASEVAGVYGQASERVASICRVLGADQYLTGTGALDYMNRRDFLEIGCEIKVQRWERFTYDQPHGDFVPDLSTLDMVLNCPDRAADLILKAGSWEAL